MALSYFGLQLGSLTVAASLAWILSSHFWSQVGFNLENFELGFNFFSRIFEIQPQAKGSVRSEGIPPCEAFLCPQFQIERD